MSGYAVKSIDEMEAIHHGAVKLAGAELGLQSFGMQVLDLPGSWPDYPEHDHAEDGQEEVYVVLSGSAECQVDGDRAELVPGQAMRVSPGVMRKLLPGPDGARILAIGAVADSRYERPEGFRLEVGA